jgi:hypothetical protein
MPAYWFMYNMYALERNAWKYKDRDKRIEKKQLIEYDYLAPDTVNEIFDAIKLLEKLTVNENGEALTNGIENTNRKTKILKVPQSIKVFKELVQHYGIINLIEHYQQNNFTNFEDFKKSLPASITRASFMNIGGQLMKTTALNKIKADVVANNISSWADMHNRYKTEGTDYTKDLLEHAYCSLLEILCITTKQFTSELFKDLLQQTIATKQWMTEGILKSREKDYTNPYRKMVYENNNEMNKVIGKLEDNSFIQGQFEGLEDFKEIINSTTL